MTLPLPGDRPEHDASMQRGTIGLRLPSPA
jgi:hypothetical protein